MAFHLGTSEPRPNGLAARESQLGHTYTHYHDFMGGGFGAWHPAHPDKSTLITFASGDTKNGVKPWIQDTLAGKLDTAIKATANSVKTYGKPVRLGVWQEMNGGWMSTNAKHCGGYANFIKAYQHVASIIKGIAPNAIMCWIPNVQTYSGVENPELYWPGDSYVDEVFFDGYCKNGYKSPAFLFQKALTSFGPGSKHAKPFGIAETAAAKDSSPDKYVNEMATWLAAYPECNTVHWFDNTNSARNWYYGVDSTSAELTAYKKLCAKAAT
jgi:hypothetical protein